jgi:hypothetical protein
MSEWVKSSRWQGVLTEMEKDEPYVIIRQHDGQQGIGTELLSQIKEINETMRRKGCQFTLSTVLRDPAKRSESHMHFLNTLQRRHFKRPVNENNHNISEVQQAWAHDTADYMTDFLIKNSYYENNLPNILFGPRTEETRLGYPSIQPASPSQVQQAIEVLSMFDSVGRLEDIGSYLSQMTKFLGLAETVKIQKSNSNTKRYFTTSDRFYEIACSYLHGDEALYHHFFPGVQTTCDQVGMKLAGNAVAGITESDSNTSTAATRRRPPAPAFILSEAFV